MIVQAAHEPDDALRDSLESMPELDAFLEQEATLLLVLLYEVPQRARLIDPSSPIA